MTHVIGHGSLGAPGDNLRLIFWITAALLIGTGVLLIVYLLKPKQISIPSGLTVADLTGIISLLLNAALFLATIISLWIAIAAYRGSEESGRQQQITLDASRAALQTTADTLQSSAEHFRKTAEAATGQYELLQSEKREREAAVLSTLLQELLFNQKAIETNEISIEQELKVLKQNQSLVGPLQALHIGGWELLRIYIPPELSTGTILSKLTEAYTITGKVNEMIRSREEYRLHNGAMSNFASHMAIYDGELANENGEAARVIREVVPLLESLTKRRH